MSSSERPSPEPLLKNEASKPYWGGRILEMLWRPQMPWIIGPGGSQTYSQQEIQEKLSKRFRGLSKIVRQFFRKVSAALWVLRDDFREGDEDSNFSAFRVRQLTEWPRPLHWIAFLVDIRTKPLIHWIASPPFHWKPFFSLKSASSHPLPKNRLKGMALRWAKSRDSYRRIASESYRCDSNR